MSALMDHWLAYTTQELRFNFQTCWVEFIGAIGYQPTQGP